MKTKIVSGMFFALVLIFSIGIISNQDSLENKEWGNSLSIVKNSVDSEGNFVLKITGMSGKEIEITKLSVGNYSEEVSEKISFDESKNFVIKNEGVCSGRKNISENVSVEYIDSEGKIHAEEFPAELFFMCENQSARFLTDRCPSCTVSYDGNASTGSVLSGYTFYSDSSSLLTGTIETKDLNNQTPSFETGYYSAGDLNSVDSNLVATNIASGTTIFGIDGTASTGGLANSGFTQGR